MSEITQVIDTIIGAIKGGCLNEPKYDPDDSRYYGPEAGELLRCYLGAEGETSDEEAAIGVIEHCVVIAGDIERRSFAAVRCEVCACFLRECELGLRECTDCGYS